MEEEREGERILPVSTCMLASSTNKREDCNTTFPLVTVILEFDVMSEPTIFRLPVWIWKRPLLMEILELV
jgi:hypothetical protein